MEAEATAAEVEELKAQLEAAGGDADAEHTPRQLEALLREQGIVQHKPKKGRRIIDQAPIADRKPIPKPVIRQDVVAQAMARQARQGGFGEDAQPAGQPRDGGRRRGPGPDRLARELRNEREREKKLQRPRRKGRRKSIVQRPDMVYYPDRRSTRKKTKASAGPGRKTQMTTPKAAKRAST